MQPVNNKSMLHFLFGQMEKLDKKEITVEQAKTMADLAKQANNMLKYELDRANTSMKICEFNAENGTKIVIRDVEGNSF